MTCPATPSGHAATCLATEHDHRCALSPDAGARRLRSARVKRGKLLGLMRSGRPLTISGPEALVGEIPEALPGRELATGAA
jgi:hypothetical protein